MTICRPTQGCNTIRVFRGRIEANQIRRRLGSQHQLHLISFANMRQPPDEIGLESSGWPPRTFYGFLCVRHADSRVLGCNTLKTFLEHLGKQVTCCVPGVNMETAIKMVCMQMTIGFIYETSLRRLASGYTEPLG